MCHLCLVTWFYNSIGYSHGGQWWLIKAGTTRCIWEQLSSMVNAEGWWMSVKTNHIQPCSEINSKYWVCIISNLIIKILVSLEEPCSKFCCKNDGHQRLDSGLQNDTPDSPQRAVWNSGGWSKTKLTLANGHVANEDFGTRNIQKSDTKSLPMHLATLDRTGLVRLRIKAHTTHITIYYPGYCMYPAFWCLLQVFRQNWCFIFVAAESLAMFGTRSRAKLWTAMMCSSATHMAWASADHTPGCYLCHAFVL